MEFRLLGPFEARTAAGPIPLGSPQQRFVLVALLLEPNWVVQRTRLIDMMWPDAVPASAHNALQVYVSRLRGVLRDSSDGQAWIERVGTGYRLVVDPCALDVNRFHAIVSAARTLTSQAETAVRLREALSLWRGEPLADLDSPWLRRHVCSAFSEAWLDVHEDLFEAEMNCGNHRRVLPEIRRLFGQHPTRERLAGLLMRALYRNGRRAEALGVYREVAAIFTADLGIDPSGALATLHQAMLRNEPDSSGALRVH
ncbi:MAG: AfsR/SARP family transcriptional regulator [Micromonosporaceae bacterium]